jgi:acyl transferase domain-containing protein
MDPHQTIMLDVAYQAFIAAGFHKATLVSTETGVFVGCSSNVFSTEINA